MKHEACVIVFARAPVAGHVKTRLGSILEQSQVLNLYKCFVHDLLSKLDLADLHPMIFFHPPGARQMMVDWLGDEFSYVAQHGADLGERMANAFSEAFRSGMNRAVLMGSDLPDLPGEIITDAFSGLDTHDAVIGPATDGGYYLIGFRKDTFLPAVFMDIPWGSDMVYEKSIEIFEKYGKRVIDMPKWRDIDTYEDLLDFIRTHRDTGTHAPKTVAFLEKTGLVRKGIEHASRKISKNV